MTKPTQQPSPENPAGSWSFNATKMRRMAGVFSAFAALSVGFFAETAQAQDLDLPDIQLQRFRPAPGPADFLNVYSSGIAKHLEWDASFYLDFADNPLQLAARGARYSETVDAQTTLSLLGSVGLFDRFEVGLLIPVTVFQASQGLQPILPPGSEDSTDLSIMGINDWRLSAKYQILDPRDELVGLALVGSLYAPIATQNTLTSDAGVGGEVLAAADYFIWRGMRVGANLGYRYRPMKETFRDATIGDEFLWGAALSVPVFMRELDAILEIDGAVSLAEKGRALRNGEVPAEIKLAGRYAITDNWTLTAGGGSGLTNGVGTPDLRLFVGLGGYWVYGGEWSMDYKSPAFDGRTSPCPDGSPSENGCPEPDSDGDGVPDSVDRCPNTPPGTRVMTDGCPEDDFGDDGPPVLELPDRDGDGILDRDDDCPDVPGVAEYNGCPPDRDGDGIPDDQDDCPDEFGVPERNGCPDPGRKVVVTKDKIVIIDKVHFETSKATIRPDSFDILNEVVEVLEDHPHIEALRIEGHTDSRGRKAFNDKLSQQRADSVRKYLIDKGIAPSRLTAKGYGPSTPIDTNDTAEGRANNRRVEFTILTGEDSVDE